MTEPGSSWPSSHEEGLYHSIRLRGDGWGCVCWLGNSTSWGRWWPQSSWAVQGELEQFLSSWQEQLHPVFLREFPVWLLSDAVSDLNLAIGRKLWQPIQITLFKMKLNQSFSVIMVLVSPDGQTGGVHTNTQHLLCALQGLVCRYCGHRAPLSLCWWTVPHFKRFLGLWAKSCSELEFFLYNFKFL